MTNNQVRPEQPEPNPQLKSGSPCTIQRRSTLQAKIRQLLKLGSAAIERPPRFSVYAIISELRLSALPVAICQRVLGSVVQSFVVGRRGWVGGG
ncbi:unnamed protein product [Gongylonema pulchrum]|uniref:Histone domain-containing protein n=1 Tax=Gongylonema pulchrum TaxID=637853 RepID=A0A183DWR8_9BILA|nr:unnamed protein product [Gongylonema pulchrum]